LAEGWDVPWRKPIASLSTGDQRKAAILVAFAGRPEVLVLDEPAAGFDLVARRELIDLIVDRITQAEGCTVLFSTHILGDLERVADHIGVLSGGRMAFSARLEDLLGTMKRVQLIFEDRPSAALAIPGALRLHACGTVVTAIVRWNHGGELELLQRSIDARVQVFPMGLEEIFLELFGNGKAESWAVFDSPQPSTRNELI
jgi:ABC-type multidrug transport system ATPase subunit